MNSLVQTINQEFGLISSQTNLPTGTIVLPRTFPPYWAYSARLTFVESQNPHNREEEDSSLTHVQKVAIYRIIHQIRNGAVVHPMGFFASSFLSALNAEYSAESNLEGSNNTKPVIKVKHMAGWSGVSFSGMVQEDKFLFGAKPKVQGNFHSIYVNKLVEIAQQNNAQLDIFGSKSHGYSIHYG